MNKKTRSILLILLTIIITLPLMEIPELGSTVLAAEKVSLNSSTKTIQSYAVKKSSTKKKATKKKTVTTPIGSLADAYANYFAMGVATPYYIYQDNTVLPTLLKQFRTITMENETKPDALLDYENSHANVAKYNTSPAVRLQGFEQYLKWAQTNNFKMRFHTLVWYNQTPRWFFTENYSRENNAPLVSKEIMLQRMENYIRQIMECAKKYPDVIYAWDVVNEAIEPADNHSKGYRTKNNYWYKIIGEDYVEMAFTYARKYSYDKAGLFYNDYNEYQVPKINFICNMIKNLKDKNLIDGIGMQSHLDMSYPALGDYEAAIKRYAGMGLEINITELDMHNAKNSASALKNQAERYKSIFQMFLNLKKNGTANITHVTFWGIRDCDTWLVELKQEDSYPLLFDENSKPKAAFDSIMSLVK